MSQISDVGVSFKMSGADSFESRLKSLENQWKSFSGSFNQTPAINKHFDKMTSHLSNAEKKITKTLNTIKAAAIGVLAVQGGNKIFDSLIGNEAVSEAKSFNNWTMGENRLKQYESTMAKLREDYKVDRDDLQKGVYQIDTAMSGKPIEESIKVLETLPYYMKLTGKTFEESAKFVKGFFASFGDSLPIKEQSEYAEKTLGQLLKVAQISKSDPVQVSDTLGRLGALYSSMGFKQSELFADVSSLTPRLGGRPEIAATAINAILPNSSEIAQKLAKADYEQAFAQGRAFDDTGKRSRNWGSLANLKDRAAERNKQAMEDLAELERSSGRLGERAGIKAQQFLNNRDRHGLMNYLGELIEKSKDNPLAQKVLKDALGEQYNAGLAWIEDFKRKEIKRLEDEYNNVSGRNAMQTGKAAMQKELPHKATTLKQASEDFQSNLRVIFYEPMALLLDEWKNVLIQTNASFAGENGTKKLQSLGGAIVQGTRDVFGPGNIAGDSRSIGEIFQQWVTSLNPEDFRSASRTLSQAAQDFSSVVRLFGNIVSEIHKTHQRLFPQATGPKKENETDLLWGAFRYNPDKGILPWLRRGAPIDENYLPRAAPQSQGDMLMPAHKSTPMLAPPASSGSSTGSGGLSSLNITSQPQVTVNIDDRAIKDAVKVEVKDEIKEDLLREQSRNRANSLDQSLMATN